MQTKDKSKLRTKVSNPYKINTVHIFGNKSENKQRATVSKFNFQKSSQKTIYINNKIKPISTIDNQIHTTKTIKVKISKNNSI